MASVFAVRILDLFLDHFQYLVGAMMFIALGAFALGMGCLTQAAGGYWVIALGVGLTGLLGGFMVPIESFIASHGAAD
jgi:hypothetical protein